MLKIYIVPIETVIDGSGLERRGPEYFVWRFDANPPSIDCAWGMMDYGFIPFALLVARDITQTDHDALILNSDVYAFPDDLDQPITDPTIDPFFEAINIPTNWLTPSTTYRELLRYVAGMFQFNQRYGGISGVNASVFDNGRTLDSRWNNLSEQEKQWFNDTLASFGFPSGVAGNPPLRTLAKQAGDLWGDSPFIVGGVEF